MSTTHFLTLISLLLVFQAPARALTLANSGRARCSIVIAQDATAPEKTAARELQDYLERVTGASFQVRLESEVSAGQPQILIGPSRRLKSLAPDVDWKSLGRDGIVIRTAGNKLLLAGGRPRGTLYAVYTFLEDTVGCRWWTGTEEFVPKKAVLTVPRLNVVYVPALRYREAYYRDPLEHPTFAARLKLNGHHYNIPAEYGDHYKILGWCHTFYQLLPPSEYFDKHPEWYSEINGKRVSGGAQLCLTNNEMRAELTRVAVEWIRKNPTAGIISISQNDCGGSCQCAKCRAVEHEEGSPAGPLIWFVNAVAADIYADVYKESPDVLVETLAYQYTRKPPLKVRPRNNVVVRLCTIECDFARPLESDANRTFRDDIRGWSAIAPNLYVWDYVTDFASYIQPHPNMRVLGPNIRFFTANKVIGLFEQGDSATSVGDFVRLRAWLLAHLQWDPSLDPRKLTDQFLDGYYGPAAPYLRRYLDLIHNAAETNGLRLGCYNGNLSFLTLQVMTEASRLFDGAARAVAADPVLTKRVRRERMPLDHVWLLRYNELKWQADADKAEFAGPKDGRAACSEFIRLAREWDARNYSEGMGFEAYVPGLEARFAPPAPAPEEFAKLPPNDVLDIQDAAFKLFNPPVHSKTADDPKASDGKVAFMPGSHGEWAVQYHVSEEMAKAHEGRWKWYVIARTEGEKSGQAFQYGIYDNNDRREVAKFAAGLELAADGAYHTYYLGTHKLKGGLYVWMAPYGNGDAVKGIYVDRLILVRDSGE